MAVVPKIKGLKPCGTQILVELLNEDEILGTTLELPSSAAPSSGSLLDAPQAYILSIGPRVDDQWGYEEGDRVIFSGQFTPAPDYDKHPRARGTIDPHSIKAVLEEESELTL
jgi:hypothetical protein